MVRLILAVIAPSFLSCSSFYDIKWNKRNNRVISSLLPLFFSCCERVKSQFWKEMRSTHFTGSLIGNSIHLRGKTSAGLLYLYIVIYQRAAHFYQFLLWIC